MKTPKLIKIDFTIKYSVVGENVYTSENLDELASEILRANRNDIIAEACNCPTNAKISVKGTPINSEKDLPAGYNVKCLPWKNVVYGEKGEYTIGQILKGTENEK